MENLSGLGVNAVKPKVVDESEVMEEATKLSEEDKEMAAARGSESTATKVESPSTVESVEVMLESIEKEMEVAINGMDNEIISDREVGAAGELKKRRRTTSKSPDRKRKPSEKWLVCSIAEVKVFDEVSRRWVPSGGRSRSPAGVSRVRISHQPTSNTFRVVGRTVLDDQPVISCPITRGLEYHQTKPTFHQWLDRSRPYRCMQWYGLGFSSTEDAADFAIAMFDVLEMLNSQRHPPIMQAPPLGRLSSTIGPLPPPQGHHHRYTPVVDSRS